MWHKAEWMGHPMRLELTLAGLLVKLANHYTTRGAQYSNQMVEEISLGLQETWRLGKEKLVKKPGFRGRASGYWDKSGK